MKNDKMIEILLNAIGKIEKKLDRHMEGGCGTQRELTEHKINHKWWIITFLMIFGIVVTLWGVLK